MKKLLIASLLLIAVQAKSQTFEGTVKMSMKMEVTDPKIKAQMEQAQKQMADPAQQARMKQAMEKMNDPQMKAMLDANPQLKAQMETAMKAMQSGGDPIAAAMPSGYTIKIKGGNTLMIMEGGAMPMEILYLKNQNKSVHLDRKNKTYWVASQGENGNPSQSDEVKPLVKVTKTNEKTKILTYNCTKYIATVTEQGKTVDQIYWTTTDIKDFDMKGLAQQRVGRGQSMFYEGIEGVPLKMEIIAPEGKMMMETTEIKRGSLSANDFVIPTDFKETQGMFGGRN
jgi:Domain of unknown function (DUF4412)